MNTEQTKMRTEKLIQQSYFGMHKIILGERKKMMAKHIVLNNWDWIYEMSFDKYVHIISVMYLKKIYCAVKSLAGSS